MSFDRSSLILDRSSQVDLHSKSCRTLDSNFTHKHTLSKSKTRLNRFDHGLPILQNEVLIHQFLVPQNLTAQKLACHCEAHKLSRDWLPSKSKAKVGYPIKGKEYILPIAQMKGAHLSKKSLHQILRYLVPHGVRQNAKKVLKSLLDQEGVVAYISGRVQQAGRERKPCSSTTIPLSSLHSRSNKSYLLARVFICPESTSGKEKGTYLTLLNLSGRMPLSSHAEDEYPRYSHQPLQCRPKLWPNRE